MPTYSIRTYKICVPSEMHALCSELNRTAARIYNKTLSLMKKVKKEKGFWLSWNEAQKYVLLWASDINIHFRSKEAIIQQYFYALNGYYKAVKQQPHLKPPYKKKRFMSFIWKDSSIKLLSDGTLRLSMGRKRDPIVLRTHLSSDIKIRRARLVYEYGRYYLHLAIEVESKQEKSLQNGIMAVDLGILRPITCFDGHEVISYNGGTLNALVRYRNKILAEFQKILSHCGKNSKRYKKLLKAKRERLRKIKHQITDILHKITSNFLKLCIEKDIKTIVIGNVVNIRRRNISKYARQKLHQWCFRKLIELITYKAKSAGINVKLISEKYTSKICPVCGSMNYTKNRNYKCGNCNFKYHGDGVGAINIWNKYLGTSSQVVADLAPVRGIRFNPYLCGHGTKNIPWKAA